MKSILIAGNWKMNAGPAEAGRLLHQLKDNLVKMESPAEVIIFPPFVSLHLAVSLMKESSVQVGAQNVHFEDNGAFTGEISTSMLKEVGCSHVILGHSERREHFGETDRIIAKKTRKAIDDGLHVILCVGENLEQRNKGDHQKVVMEQLQAVTDYLTEKDVPRLTIAYEPVWAIGTGETATPQQAQEMHRFIRNYITELWSTQKLGIVRILYGGSMKEANAEELLAQPDVDGGLIGGASLDADHFCQIIDKAKNG